MGYMPLGFRAVLAREMVIMHFEQYGVPRDDEGNIAPDDLIVQAATKWSTSQAEHDELCERLFAVFAPGDSRD